MKAKTKEKTLLTVKTDKELKKRAQETAEVIGIPLGTIINAYLREFVVERRVAFAAPERMTPKLEADIAEIERDIAEGKNLSGPFHTAEAFIAHLNKRR